MKFIGIIPARYASTRFPGKPLAMIGDRSMVMRVFDQATKASSLSEVVVATDDARIFDHVLTFGGKAVMTSDKHPCGTDRVNEAISKLLSNNGDPDEAVVINIQGDEPFIDPNAIDTLSASFANPEISIATLIKKITSTAELSNPNVVKVITGKSKRALYFSRSPLPFIRGVEVSDWITKHSYFKHIGIYAYRARVLGKLAGLPPTPLEKAEGLEQLRWLENGYVIHTIETDYESIAVDSPEDLLKITNKV